MSNETPKGSSFQYRLTDNFSGRGVSQYDFGLHGRDRAGRLLPPETRLSLYLFSPAREWKHVGIFNKESYLDVPLGKLRMNYPQFEMAARAVFEKLGIEGMLTLGTIREGTVHKVRVKLPQQVLQEKNAAMDAVYEQASDAEKQRNNSSPSR